jgi:hypothetical protein
VNPRVHHPEIEFVGPGVARHNQACAVYHHDTSAVLNCNTGVFHPSWKAQQEGWRLVRADNWWKRLLVNMIESE